MLVSCYYFRSSKNPDKISSMTDIKLLKQQLNTLGSCETEDVFA